MKYVYLNQNLIEYYPNYIKFFFGQLLKSRCKIQTFWKICVGKPYLFVESRGIFKPKHTVFAPLP